MLSYNRHLALSNSPLASISHMLAANKVKQKTESIIILDKVLKDFPLLLSIEIIFPYNYLGFTSHSYIYIFQLLLFYPDTLCTSPECLDQLL